MTKAELIEGLANKLNLQQGRGRKGDQHPPRRHLAALKQGERVTSRASVPFRFRSGRPRTGRNPKTGETIQISASRSAKFQAGKQLKDSLNEAGRRRRLAGESAVGLRPRAPQIAVLATAPEY